MELKIEYVPIEELKPYAYNARKHDKESIEAIKASIEEFGFDDPIGVWKNNVIIEGHGRYLAGKELGLETVPIIRLDHLTEEQRRAYALAHNKTTEVSTWDYGLLDKELDDILDIDMSKFGFLNFDMDIDMESFLENVTESTPKKRTVTCPHCGEEIEL